MKIFVSRELPENSLVTLKETEHEVLVSNVNRPLTPAELLQNIKGVDGILSLLTDKIDGEVMDAAGPNLRVVSNYAVGFDNVDIDAATKRGIVVTNTPNDAVNEAVAELAWALMFALSRRVVEADEATRKGAYKGWEPDIFLGNQISGKTLGIVGLGNIGTMVARKASGFSMKVLYNKHSPDPEVEKSLGITYATLEELLKTSDFITLHVPLNEQTRHMMKKETFAMMKPGSYLINTARGAVVNEHDLVEALRANHLAGAALDVYDNEPNINPELIGMENVVLTPHIASATHEARVEMGKMAVDALIQTFKGQMPTNIVNKEVWDARRQ